MRLKPFGITVSNVTLTKVQEQINHAVIQAVKEGKTIRIVSDDVNIMVARSH